MNNIKILKNYILYFLTMLLVCMVGISDIFAETLENIGYLDNYTDVLVEVSYNAQPLPLTRTNTYQLGSVDAMDIEVSNYTFTAGITYVLEFYTPHTTLDYANAFTVVGNDNNNNSVSCATSDIGYHDTYYLTMKFNCSSNVNYINARVYNLQGNYIMDTGLFAWNYLYLRRVASGTDLSVLESQNAQIIQGQQDIINNQNENTDKVIESQQVCSVIDKKNIVIENSYLYSNGGIYVSNGFGITDYINLSNISSIKRSVSYGPSSGSYYCFYDINKTLISCSSIGGDIGIISIPSGSKYFRSSIYYNSNSPQYELCKNGNQAVSDSINDLNDTLNNDSPIDVSSLGNTVGWLPAGPIDSIINLPLNFFNSISSALSGTCSPLNISIPYINTNISIPCLSTIFGQINGLTSFWNWVGRIASIYILYKYLLALWDYYDRLTTLQVNFRDDFGGGI